MKFFNFVAIVLLANSVEAVKMRNHAQIFSINPTDASRYNAGMSLAQTTESN